MKTFVAKPKEITRKWLLVDAEGKVLGRLATQVATILRGKHKPIFSPHVDVGDHVIIVNADKVRVTGKKSRTKQYFRHTGYPGGGRHTSFSDMLAKHPERILEAAIRGMLPHNKLGRQMYKKLKVYPGEGHPHEAQKPEKIELA